MKYLKTYERMQTDSEYITDMTNYFILHDQPYLNAWKGYIGEFSSGVYSFENEKFPDVILCATPFYNKEMQIPFDVYYKDSATSCGIMEIDKIPKTENEREEFFNWYFNEIKIFINLFERCEKAKEFLEILIKGEGKNNKLELNVKVDSDIIKEIEIDNNHIIYVDRIAIHHFDLNKLSKLYHILAEKYPYLIDSISSGYFNLKK